jgi:hypothetical protein
MARCSICQTLVAPADERTLCPECQQEYHASCWKELGGCGTYGCKSAAVAEKPPPPVLVGSGWGDTKVCPACGMNIGSSLLICRCGARFPWADPMTPAEYQSLLEKQRSVSTSKSLLVVLFLLTLLGITAPVTGTIAGIYSYFKREQLSGANGTYLALGVGSAALGVTYGFVMIMLGLGF